MDVVVWLRGLGLRKYEAAFRENEIDETVLSSLTHETLEELGVTAVGHRLKLLNSIAALRRNTTSPAPSADPTTTSEAPNVSPEGRAERGQVTMMFSDLVGSTALSARILKTSAKSFRPIRSASQRPWVAMVASSQSTWVTASWFTSAIRRLTRTTPSEPCRTRHRHKASVMLHYGGREN